MKQHIIGLDRVQGSTTIIAQVWNKLSPTDVMAKNVDKDK